MKKVPQATQKEIDAEKVSLIVSQDEKKVSQPEKEAVEPTKVDDAKEKKNEESKWILAIILPSAVCQTIVNGNLIL